MKKFLLVLGFLCLHHIAFAYTLEDYRSEIYQGVLEECDERAGQEKAICQCQAKIIANDVINGLTSKEKELIIKDEELSDEVVREIETKVVMLAAQSASNMDNAIKCSKSVLVSDCAANGKLECNHSKSCCECLIDAMFDGMTYKEMMVTNPTPESQKKMLQIIKANHARCVKK